MLLGFATFNQPYRVKLFTHFVLMFPFIETSSSIPQHFLQNTETQNLDTK